MTFDLLGEHEAADFRRAGHFAYEGGGHGDTWLALGLLFADPRRLQHAAARLACQLRRYEADLVCGPLIGGALVGQWIAHELGLGFVYAEARPPEGYAIPAELHAAVSGRRAVVVDDVINAGSATLAGARAVESLGGRVVAAGALMVREGATLDLTRRLGAPVEALVSLSWRVWPPPDCPLCRSGMAMTAIP